MILSSLNLAYHLSWCRDHLLDLQSEVQLEWSWENLSGIRFVIHLAHLLVWHLKIPLVHGFDIWLYFHLEHWMALWLALGKDIWLGHHWYFHLNYYLEWLL